MNAEKTALLKVCFDKQEAHRRTKRPPAWKTWDCAEWDEEREFGPHYSAPQWFGEGIGEAQRQRFRRALAQLVGAGLVETWSRWGNRISRVRLTEAGVAAAKQLEGK